ncbi:MAG: hypothetical protein ACON4U_20270 [Myxococcota bacterium]
MDHSSKKSIVAIFLVISVAFYEGGSASVLSLVWALMMFGAFVLVGRDLSYRLFPLVRVGLLAEVILGMVITGCLALFCGLVGLGLWPVVFFVLIFGLWKLHLVHLGTLPRLTVTNGLAILIFTIVCLLDVLKVPQGADELYYHLPLAKHYWQEGSLIGGELRPNGSRPQLLHLIYALVWSVGEHRSVGCFQLLLGTLLTVEVSREANKHQKGSGLIAVVLLIGSYSWLLANGQVGSDIPVATALWSAYLLRHSPIAIVLLGTALSWKYTAVGLVLTIGAITFRPQSDYLKAVITAALICFMGILFNLTEGHHPFFPYLGWSTEMPFQILDRYGMGRLPQDFLSLPVRMVLNAQADGLQFLGQLNMLWLGLLPCVLAGRRHFCLAVVVGLGFVFWAMGPHLLRHFVLVMPFGAVLMALVLGTWSRLRWLVLAVGILSLPDNWSVLLSDTGPHGTRSVKDPCRSALLQSNDALPEDSTVALMYCWSGYLLEHSYVLSSIEDHIPTRQWLIKHGVDSVKQLRSEANVDFVVVGPSPFGRKPYDGVTKEDWSAFYLKPEAELEEALIQDGVLIFQSGQSRVYRIREK